jgi:hypothetical protein
MRGSKMVNNCPINFGDCPDCELYVENECIHNFWDEINQDQLIEFIKLAKTMGTITPHQAEMLEDLAEKCTDNEEEDE